MRLPDARRSEPGFPKKNLLSPATERSGGTSAVRLLSPLRRRRRCMLFQKGQSGNPAGRPRGSRNRASIRRQRMLEKKGRALLDKAVELAMDGNIAALRLCLDRV